MPRTLHPLCQLSLLLGLLAASVQPVHAADSLTLEVLVSALKSASGTLRLSLYQEPRTFRKEAQALRVIEVPAQAGEMQVSIPNLPPGRYAVMAYHDTNGNQKLDLRLGMFPIEPYGLSNNPQVFGPPAFDDSAFELQEPMQKLRISLRD